MGDDWRDRAACVGGNIDLFFARNETRIALAKAVCARCPVRAECLAHAVDHDEEYGVWGGTSAEERAARAREQRLARRRVVDRRRRQRLSSEGGQHYGEERS